MARKSTVETRQDRLALAEDAGMGTVSPVSVLAGVMCAYGTFVLVLALATAGLRAAGLTSDYSANDWRSLGTGAGLVVAAVALAAWLFGGYVAGRMARRAGTTHGLLVFASGLVIAAIAAALANAVTDSGNIVRNLRSIGIPTSAGEWRDAGTIAGIASLAAMLVGSVAGGGLGERWHGRLLARALDPRVGAEADLRRRSEESRSGAEKRHDAAQRRVVAARGTAALTKAGADRRDEEVPSDEATMTAGTPDAAALSADHDRSVDTDGNGQPDAVVGRRPRRGLLRR